MEQTDVLKQNTSSIQGALARYCREGAAIDLPGITPGRLEHYRRLVLNVVHGILSEAYPIAARFLGSSKWGELVEQFFANHKCHNPQVWLMARELLDFIEETAYHEAKELPFLPDLLLMEWTEIEVHSMPDNTTPPSTPCPDSQLLSTHLVFNPHYKLLHLSYPVHRIHLDDFEPKPGNFFLLVFREEKSGKVQFVSLSPYFATLLDTVLQSEGIDVLGAKNALVEAGIHAPKSIHEPQLVYFLKSLQDKQFIFGKVA